VRRERRLHRTEDIPHIVRGPHVVRHDRQPGPIPTAVPLLELLHLPQTPIVVPYPLLLVAPLLTEQEGYVVGHDRRAVGRFGDGERSVGFGEDETGVGAEVVRAEGSMLREAREESRRDWRRVELVEKGVEGSGLAVERLW